MRRSVLLPAAALLATAGLLTACSGATDAINAVQGAASAVGSVQDLCAEAETALASGEPSSQIAAAFSQPLAELRSLLEGATLIPGLQGVVDSLDSAQAALEGGTANTAELSQQIADACSVVGQ